MTEKFRVGDVVRYKHGGIMEYIVIDGDHEENWVRVRSRLDHAAPVAYYHQDDLENVVVNETPRAKFAATGACLDEEQLAFFHGVIKTLAQLPTMDHGGLSFYLGEIPVFDDEGNQVAVISDKEFGYWLLQF